MINGVRLGSFVGFLNNNALNNFIVLSLEVVNSSFMKLKLGICLIFFDKQMEVVFVHIFLSALLCSLWISFTFPDALMAGAT